MTATSPTSEFWECELSSASALTSFRQKIASLFQRANDDWLKAHQRDEAAEAHVGVTVSEYRITQSDVVLLSRDRLHLMEWAIRETTALVAELESLGNRTDDRDEPRILREPPNPKEYWLVDPGCQTIDVMYVEADRHVLVTRRDRNNEPASGLPGGSAKTANHPLPPAMVLYFILDRDAECSMRPSRKCNRKLTGRN